MVMVSVVTGGSGVIVVGRVGSSVGTEILKISKLISYVTNTQLKNREHETMNIKVIQKFNRLSYCNNIFIENINMHANYASSL